MNVKFVMVCWIKLCVGRALNVKFVIVCWCYLFEGKTTD